MWTGHVYEPPCSDILHRHRGRRGYADWPDTCPSHRRGVPGSHRERSGQGHRRVWTVLLAFRTRLSIKTVPRNPSRYVVIICRLRSARPTKICKSVILHWKHCGVSSFAEAIGHTWIPQPRLFHLSVLEHRRDPRFRLSLSGSGFSVFSRPDHNSPFCDSKGIPRAANL